MPAFKLPTIQNIIFLHFKLYHSTYLHVLVLWIEFLSIMMLFLKIKLFKLK